MELSGIYKIICRSNNKFYIGSSININRRFKDHIRLLKRNNNKNKYLQNSWNKYGEKNFKFEIIEIVNNVKQLLIREKWWIDNTNCYNRKIGFNISVDPAAPQTGNFNDLTGQKFGKLTVVKPNGKNQWGNYRWLCRCYCGKEKIISSTNLISGNTKSCGCLYVGGNNFKHGKTKIGKVSKIYKIWSNMIQRCTNPNNSSYKDYGGRDKSPIKVCNRWSNKNPKGFENFYKDVGDPPVRLILDRINNNKGYSPNNWRWATRKEQNINKKQFRKYKGI